MPEERRRWRGPNPLDIVRLAAIAEAVNDDDRAWAWRVNKPDAHQTVFRMGDAALIAETFDSTSNAPHVDGRPVGTAEYIATFDPPTVLALLNALAECLLIENGTPPG